MFLVCVKKGFFLQSLILKVSLKYCKHGVYFVRYGRGLRHQIAFKLYWVQLLLKSAPAANAGVDTAVNESSSQDSVDDETRRKKLLSWLDRAQTNTAAEVNQYLESLPPRRRKHHQQRQKQQQQPQRLQNQKHVQHEQIRPASQPETHRHRTIASAQQPREQLEQSRRLREISTETQQRQHVADLQRSLRQKMLDLQINQQRQLQANDNNNNTNNINNNNNNRPIWILIIILRLRPTRCLNAAEVTTKCLVSLKKHSKVL